MYSKLADKKVRMQPVRVFHDNKIWQKIYQTKKNSGKLDSRNYPSPKSEVVHETKCIQHIPFNTCLDGLIG